MRRVNGLLEIARNYDAFVFDQFGVLHDGQALYPHVLDVLRRLKQSGKHICILSNSGRNAAANLARTVALGVDADLISNVVTSGDVARAHRLPSYVSDFGPNCYHIASANEAQDEVSAAAGLRFVDDIADCDFVYLSGMSEGLAETWQADLLPRLIAGAKPLLCSNPDFVALGGAELTTSPGTIAQAYAQAGGVIELVGKPYGLIYEVVGDSLRAQSCANALFIGDSYHHDVRGARNAGFDAFLVLTGVHRALFDDPDIVQTAHDKLVEDGIAPTWISPTL